MQNVAERIIKVIQFYRIIKICSCYKFVCSCLMLTARLLKRKPIKTKTVISDIEQNFFCFLDIIYNHTPAAQEFDLLFKCYGYSSHSKYKVTHFFGISVSFPPLIYSGSFAV